MQFPWLRMYIISNSYVRVYDFFIWLTIEREFDPTELQVVLHSHSPCLVLENSVWISDNIFGGLVD